MAANKDIEKWDPEDQEQWESYGKRVANRNLWISIPSLLMGFIIWMMWGMITVQMRNLGFPFEDTQLFTLAAIAGLTGATLRIPASFMIRISGGRYTIFLTTSLLMIPALGTGLALQSQETPLWVFQLMAFLSGIGGGNFACSMSNISTFFPKRKQGLALGLNAGLGNFGVTTMQILIPVAMTVGIFGALGGDPMVLERASGTLIGRIEAGTETYIQNAGLLWLVALIPLAFASWFGMNNLRTISPNPGSAFEAFGKILALYGVAFVAAAIGLYLFLPRPVGLGVLNMWVALPLVIVITLGLMRLMPGEQIRPNIKKQFAIFQNKHTWSMTVLYILTFGSFIGFSAALPLSIEVIFGSMMETAADGSTTRVDNPDAPSALTYAWMGPFVGALIRPLGGWLSDKVGGSIVTQAISVVMVIASAAAGWVMMMAYNSPDPNTWFWPFLLLFIVLFAASGIGNGSTFRTVGVVFDQHQKGPVLGWTSAVAAYGAFVAPRVMGEQIEAGTPELAMYGFAVFYALCLVINWWFYLRKNAYIKNP
ncbi:NNP family nitrate/nitrite transporter-like MFS transporter [Alkalispirillum mobile]|uniref:NNP family nitrate/nitrite transporter-like MFS transporter n=1 Tax=Alkalispirillum mobile TaxID=85925 RepID=A0A498BZ94_9GAMM|nr:MFS transporter [Alkalispirillum mobile]RLK48762.1 NNP family nitrate/nitrite transporter-like MFS transporter [Alkalispirillum mobile]